MYRATKPSAAEKRKERREAMQAGFILLAVVGAAAFLVWLHNYDNGPKCDDLCQEARMDGLSAQRDAAGR